MVINIDIDDTLSEFVKQYLLFYNGIEGTTFTPEQLTTYSLSALFGITREEQRQLLQKFYSSPEFQAMPCIPGAVEGVARLRESSQLVSVTARSKSLEEQTRGWITKHFGNAFSGIFPTSFSLSGPSIRKSAVCLDLGVRLTIEDSLHHATDIASEGIPVILLDKPWNQTDSLPENVTRVYSWEEITREKFIKT